MLYLEELVDVTIAEEGQSLLGLEFLVDALNLPMQKIDLIFRKALSEYSERRPMKNTTIIRSFDYSNQEVGYITMPEGTTSCRVARYGILPNQMPRYSIDKFGEQAVEFDPVTLTCRVWPPITPLRLTYTQKYVPTTNVLIEDKIFTPYETDEAYKVLDTSYAGKTLSLQKSVVVEEEGEIVSKILSMSPTGYINEREEYGEVIKEAVLKGSLGTGTYNLKTRELNLKLKDTSVNPILINYYPRYSVVKELDIGHYVLTKLFASKFLEAVAALKAQASQQALHSIDLTTENLYDRVQELKKEVQALLKSTISYGDMAPM